MVDGPTETQRNPHDRALIADALGMSAVPEALIARHSGIIGISCNMACSVERPLVAVGVEAAERVVHHKSLSVVISRITFYQ